MPEDFLSARLTPNGLGPDARVVVVGAGHAGGACAQSLREEGFAGTITMIGAEMHPPHERPALSKAVLKDPASADLCRLAPDNWYADNSVDLKLGREVVSIDRAARLAILSNGEPIGYDALVLAVGAVARRLPGTDGLPGVVTLRTIDDSLALGRRLGQGQRLVIVGGGLIGLEVAAVACEAGLTPIIIEAADQPLARVVPAALGQRIAELHRGRGVRLLTGAEVRHIQLGPNEIHVEIDHGGPATLEVDTVLVCIGSAPETRLAAASGLMVDDGVVVDVYGRSSDPAIWAIGDCARVPARGAERGLRFETWAHARNHAAAVARNLTGAAEPYQPTPWAWSDQFEHNLQLAGVFEPDAALVWRCGENAERLTLLALHAGRLVGGATLNQPRDMRWILKMIAGGAPFREMDLADINVPLEHIFRSAAPPLAPAA